MKSSNRLLLADRLLLTFMLTAAAASIGSCSSSSSGSKSANYVSPYDSQFDPERDENGKTDVDLPEDELLERAKSAYDHGLYSVARENWLNLREQYPSSYYATLAELKIGDTFYFGGDYAAAITSYEEFIKLHPAHDATPYVRYQIGNAYHAQYSGVAHDQAPLMSAVKSYQKLLDEYPKSEYSVDARRAIDSCRELLGQHELSIAHFYLKQGLDRASEGRLRSVLENYGDTNAAQEARAELNELDPGAASPAKQTASADTGKTPPPKAPQLVADLGAGESSNSEARFRMLERLTEESSGEDTFTPAAKSPAVKESELAETESPLLWVNCEQSNDLLIYTAALNQSLVEKQMDTGNTSQTNFLLAPRSFSAPETPMKKGAAIALHCAVDAKDLRFYTAKNQSPQDVVIAELENVPAERIHAFVLDRPMRFVIVVEKQ